MDFYSGKDEMITKQNADGYFNLCGSSPATDCDLLDVIVSVSLAHCGFSGVVLSTQMNSDPGGMNHLL